MEFSNEKQKGNSSLDWLKDFDAAVVNTSVPALNTWRYGEHPGFPSWSARGSGMGSPSESFFFMI